MVKKLKPGRSKFLDSVLYARHRIQTGRVLTIDPSSGSQKSMPGYALFTAGEMDEWGTLQLDCRQALYRKLFNLGDILRERFQDIDVLVVENIAPYMSNRGTDFRNTSLVNLHKSIGAVLASVKCEYIIEVAPMTWHAWLRKHGLHDNYEKNDANDALSMALCVMEEACVPIKWEEWLISDKEE